MSNLNKYIGGSLDIGDTSFKNLPDSTEPTSLGINFDKTMVAAGILKVFYTRQSSLGVDTKILTGDFFYDETEDNWFMALSGAGNNLNTVDVEIQSNGDITYKTLDENPNTKFNLRIRAEVLEA